MRLKPIIMAAALFAALPAAASTTPTETLVEAKGPAGTLKGTLLTPSDGGAPKASPVMLIIPGSGPTDRDGNGPLGLKSDAYKLLAQALGERGVATLRIDKRGQFGSAGATVDPATLKVSDFAADVRAWIGEARRRTGARCVWIGGHSEGALVASIAAQDAADICGLVLIAGSGRRLDDLINEQVAGNPANPPEIVEQTRTTLAELRAGRTVDPAKIHPGLHGLFGAQVQPYLMSLVSYDPAAVLKGYKGPVLVVQGTHDVQVKVEDAERLAGARPGVKLVKIEGMNHMLKIAPAERNANIATYADPTLPLAPGVADAIAGFIKAN